MKNPNLAVKENPKSSNLLMVDEQAGYRGFLGSPFCTTMSLYLYENNYVSDFGETNINYPRAKDS